jgi:hypothetical protein
MPTLLVMMLMGVMMLVMDFGRGRCASLYCVPHIEENDHVSDLRCRLPEQRQELDIGARRCQMSLGSLRFLQW